MTNKISEIYGKPIYSKGGELLGTVNDIVIDTEEGEAVRLITEELKNVGKRELRRIMKEDSIKYDRVESVGDIVLLGSNITKNNKKENTEEPPIKPSI